MFDNWLLFGVIVKGTMECVDYFAKKESNIAKVHVAQILEGEYGETFTLLLEETDEGWNG